MSSMPAFTHVGAQEDGLIRRWVKEGKTASDIAGLLRRDVSTVVRRMQRLSAGNRKTRRVGRPSALSSADEAKIERAAERMIQKADAEWLVTVGMVRKALKLNCCDRVILDAFHRHGIYFRPMRQKPVLTAADVRDRAAFADQFVDKCASFWQKTVHAYMDNKFFKLYLTENARSFARKLRARGTYRKKGQGLDRAHVKPIANVDSDSFDVLIPCDI